MTKKYIQVYEMTRVNELSEQGYTLHTVATETYQEKTSARMITRPLYIMEYKDKGYSDVVEVRDAPQDEANKLLALDDGWEVASTSVSSKFYRMVKR